MKRALKQLLGRNTPDPTAPEILYQDFTPQQWTMIEYVSPYTMTSPERIAHLVAAVLYMHENRIAGSVVECGVWRGGSMMIVARLLRELGDCTRDLYLFDTYDGMPPPSDQDRDATGAPAGELLKTQPKTRDNLFWAYAPIEEVAANMHSTGYPADKVHLIKGQVEQTIPDAAPDTIGLLRLDTDWYASTLHELEHLYPRLARQGVMIVDDYGCWQGAQQAVDEFFARQLFKPLLSRIDVTARSIIKP